VSVIIPVLLENGLYDRAISLLMALSEVNSEMRENGMNTIVRTLTLAWIDRYKAENGQSSSHVRRVFIIDPTECQSLSGSIYTHINPMSSIPSTPLPPPLGLCSLVTSDSCLNYLRHILSTHSTAAGGFHLHAAVVDEILKTDCPIPSWLYTYRVSPTSAISSKSIPFDTLDSAMDYSIDDSIAHKEENPFPRLNCFVVMLRTFLSHSRIDLAVPFILTFINDCKAEKQFVTLSSQNMSSFSRSNFQEFTLDFLSDELNAIEDCEKYINTMIDKLKAIEDYRYSTNQFGEGSDDVQAMRELLSSYKDQLATALSHV
jgi:hypothetical protein